MISDRDFFALKWLIKAAEADSPRSKVDRERFAKELLDFIGKHSSTGFEYRIPGKIPPRQMREHLSDLNQQLQSVPKSMWRKKAEKYFSNQANARDWIDTVQCGLCNMLRAAVDRHSVLPDWPIWRSAKWNPAQSRYEEALDTSRNDIGNAVQAIFYDLLLRYGHLIMKCKAPRPQKRGRKSMHNAPTTEELPKCGAVFVARRVTGEYCSDRCRNRVLGRSKRRK